MNQVTCMKTRLKKTRFCYQRFVAMSLMAKDVERLVVNCVLRYGGFEQCFGLYASEGNRTMPKIATADILDLFFDPEREQDKRQIIDETRESFRELFRNVLGIESETRTPPMILHSSRKS